ncbi:VOC family protein [Actinospica robiniae]|uniref:VOC family protein n=1 Tax=Actinospica robiniae TaxID=304901 RepID=UPI00042A1ED3|nr:VOC family protein [Actinospica robiniae]
MPTLKVISIGVHDMDAARAFYVDALGLEVDDDSMAPHFVELKNDGPTLLLALCTQPQRSDYPAGATVALDFSVADAAKELARLTELGADVVHGELQPSPVGPYFAVRDPSGNVLELIQFSR